MKLKTFCVLSVFLEVLDKTNIYILFYGLQCVFHVFLISCRGLEKYEQDVINPPENFKNRYLYSFAKLF